MFIPCIPWNTDAPVEHRPYGTLGLIGLSIYLYGTGTFPEWGWPGFHGDGWALTIGVLNPLVWLTANVHGGDWLRLLADVLFLWTFGLVVEGKIGWYRFVPLYVALAAAQVAITGRLADELSPHVSVSLEGAERFISTAMVFALSAMSLVWAPKNDIRCAAWIWIKGYVYDVPIPAMVAILALASGFVAWSAESLASASLAAGVGFCLGLVAASLLMLARQAPCHGWDLFSLLAGRAGDVDLDEMRTYQERPDEQSGLDADYFARRHRAAIEILRTHLANRDATAAVELHLRMHGKLKDWQLPEAELCGLIDLLNERRSFPASIPLMFEYLRRFPSCSGPMRLELAAILLREENRPGKALGVLERIPEDSLPAELHATRDELLREAHDKAVSGEIELGEDT